MSGPAAHPDVTWPLSTPSSSGLARCACEALVVGHLAALGCAVLPPQQLCSCPPAAQAEGDGSGSDSSERCENGSDSTQPYP
ncbi:hypothetical protein TYRP_005256 [Tyrophagus putrescentiae]|nr:hypothetical protein TYRP_005256 [Tyrophagus putrescentiae]